VLVEKKITGREFTMGILEGETLPPVEIIPREGFYDYKNKYQGTTEEICPAALDDDIVREMSRLTKLGFAALRLEHYARFDYLMDGEGQLWCLEANALPGMTPTSLLPQEAAALGIGFGELCEKLIQVSLAGGEKA
jgi:D-alanine-D-alanine ligase